MLNPKESRVRANGLLHHVSTWEPEVRSSKGTILCAHGFLDVGLSFHWMASALARMGHRVVAFDWRGHGETEWLRAGGYYHFFDYVADLSALVREVGEGPLTLVGHSMGGTASVLFAASFPEAVERLVLLEGLGPEAPEPLPGPDRTRRWIDAMRLVGSRPPRLMASLDEAKGRLLQRNPGLPEAVAEKVARWSTREEAEGVVWSFDPLHRTRGPYPFRPELFMEFLGALEMPTLVVEGENGYRTRDQAEREAALRNARKVVVPEVGHMLHWLEPERLAGEIDRFMREET